MRFDTDNNPVNNNYRAFFTSAVSYGEEKIIDMSWTIQPDFSPILLIRYGGKEGIYFNDGLKIISST